MQKWVAIYPDKAACIILGAVVQKIIKPMGQVFTLQDVEAVSQIVFCGQMVFQLHALVTSLLLFLISTNEISNDWWIYEISLKISC